ncbi:uncharacterized protein [Nicotiana sylvestris]|uniref:uncharacterized protein n=1 Tax=Nicotiana sylvestris TaxID=4096 RepID=UPI00388CE4B5
MANMVGQVLESHKITFHEDELPPEGLSHNKALHITVQCEDYFITKILVDGGSSLNICPLITLRTLGKGLHEIKDGAINVKAFDGSQRSTIGEISLCLQMGPTWFDVDFQVIDIPASYNLLLGRPWIHAAGAVASTLHQAVKFEWNHQEVIIHCDGSNPIYSRQTIPMIGGRRKIGGETYHHIERVNAVDKDKWWDNKIESILNWSGYEPGKGLGKNLQGITKPIKLKEHEEDEALAAMKNLFLEEDMDCYVIFEEEGEEGPSIQAVNRGERLTNWSVRTTSAQKASGITITYLDDEPTTVTCNEAMQQTDIDSEEEDIPEEVVREVENFENRPKSNLDETEIVDLGDAENIKDTRINMHLSPSEKKEYTEFLKEYKDIFAWSYDDMTGLSTSIVAHKLPTDPICPPVKQKLRKFKPDMSLKIKEKVTKQVKARVLRVVEYPTWLANIVSVPKKDGKSFVNCFARYHQIWMYEEDAEKTAFITPWGMYFYRMMSFGLKNAGATYMRAMTTIFHDMIHKEIEVYVDDVIIKSKKVADHMEDLRKFFNRLRRYNLKLNPAKCAFGVPAGKLLGFTVSHRGIELDPSKHPDTIFIDPIPVTIHDQPAYCAHVEEEADGKPWFHDIKEYLTTGEYPGLANTTQKRTLRRLSNNFFHSGGIMYRRTPDLGLLRCVNAKEATKLLDEAFTHSNAEFFHKKSTLFFYFVLSETILGSLFKTLKCSAELKSAPTVFACRDCSILLFVLTLQLVRHS